VRVRPAKIGRMNLSLRCGALVAGSVLVLASLGGCGSDDGGARTSGRATNTESAPASGSIDDALEAMGEDGVNDTLGRVLVNVLPGATGYRVEGNSIVLDMGGSKDDDSSTCIIATSSRGGVGSTAQIVLHFADGDVTCE